MIRINYTVIAYYFVAFVMLQIPVLYKFVLFDSAFGFFYIGFILLIPYGLNPFTRLLTGFLTGLLMDIFSNTPGLHAAACTFIMFVRDQWLRTVIDDPEEDVNLSVVRLGFLRSVVYMTPLIFAHLFLIFTIEHGKWLGYGLILKRILFSTLFTFVCVVVFNFLIVGKKKRE